jgi:hypothetical protein
MPRKMQIRSVVGQMAEEPRQRCATRERVFMQWLSGFALCELIKSGGYLRLVEALGTAINLANDAGGNEDRFWA